MFTKHKFVCFFFISYFGDQRLISSILDKYETQKNDLDAFRNKYELLVKELEIALNR